MGTLKMMHMKECKGKNKARHLKNALEYIFDPKGKDRVSERWMGGNVGGNAKEVYENMMRLKQIYGKEGGRQGYHYVLTFLPGEVDENLASIITQEFCDYFFQNNYQHVFVLHNDKQHLHSHIIFNSINMDGKKYQYKDGDWKKYIQPIVNSLCKKYGLSEISLEKEAENKRGEGENISGEADQKNSKQYSKSKESRKESYEDRNNNFKKKNKMKWREERRALQKQIKGDINLAIKAANSFEDFQKILRGLDYQLRVGNSVQHGEYITFTAPGRKGVRSYTLGAGYSLADIKYQIKNKNLLKLADDKFSKDSFYRYRRIYYHTPENLKRMFLKNAYLIRNWNGEYLKLFPQSYKYKKSLEELKQTEEECSYIHDMKIESVEAIEEKLRYLDYKLKELGQKRFEIIRNSGENPSQEEIEVLGEIATTYKRYMKEKNMLNRIKNRNEDMKNREREMEKEKEMENRKNKHVTL